MAQLIEAVPTLQKILLFLHSSNSHLSAFSFFSSKLTNDSAHYIRTAAVGFFHFPPSFFLARQCSSIGQLGYLLHLTVAAQTFLEAEDTVVENCESEGIPVSATMIATSQFFNLPFVSFFPSLLLLCWQSCLVADVYCNRVMHFELIFRMPFLPVHQSFGISHSVSHFPPTEFCCLMPSPNIHTHTIASQFLI